MTVWLFLSAGVLAVLVIGVFFALTWGTYSEKEGVVRASNPACNHYIGEGVLFLPSRHEVEVEVDGVVHHCWSNSSWEVGQQVVVVGVQNTNWKALKIER